MTVIAVTTILSYTKSCKIIYKSMKKYLAIRYIMKRTPRRGEVRFPIRSSSQMSTMKKKIYGCQRRLAKVVVVVILLADRLRHRHRVVNRGRKANLVKIAVAAAAMMDGAEMVGGDRHGHHRQRQTMASQQQ